MQAALFGPLKTIHGVADKVLHMTFAALLLGGDPRRERWVEVGGSMIAVDRLVHNFLHRTGIFDRCKARHRYGPACYRAGGCAAIIDQAARRLDARAFDPGFPIYFPRFVQYSLWAFCARDGRDICNGNKIDDRERCAQRECPVFSICDRVVLRPQTTRAHEPAVATARARSPPD